MTGRWRDLTSRRVTRAREWAHVAACPSCRALVRPWLRNADLAVVIALGAALGLSGLWWLPLLLARSVGG